MHRRARSIAAALSIAAGAGACGGGSSPPQHFSTPVVLSGASIAADGTIDRVPLAIWGDAPSSVYFVGGGVGVVSGGKPIPGLFMHYDGKAFTEIGPRVPATLWWVTGFGPTDVWASGEQGTIVHYDGSSLTQVHSPTEATLAGIWGVSAQDLWAVGGTFGGATGENDVIVHCTGDCTSAANWQKVPPPQKTGEAYFKVWGSSDSNIVLVGLGGVIAHYDGMTWTLVQSPTRSPLLTVNGRAAGDIWAVGGPPGVLVHSTDGVKWTVDETQMFQTGLTGVLAHPGGDLFVVGLGGQKYWKRSGAWLDYTEDPPCDDLHAVWIDSTGKNGFAVGGNYVTLPSATSRRTGVIARLGAPIAPAMLVGP